MSSTTLSPSSRSFGSSAPPALKVEGLVKRYDGDFLAVDGLSFAVKPGEFFGFLGPNGAGKTSTISAICGLASYQAGRIEVFGHEVRQNYREARRHVGLAAQEFNFDRYLSIVEVLVYQAGYFGIPAKEARPRAEALLEAFGLASKAKDGFMKLSGGMKRRLALARALIHGPKLLILDEPTAGVDLELRLELWALLRRLNEGGLTIMLTTHYLEEAEALCHRIGIMRSGQLVACDTPKALLANVAKTAVALDLDRPLEALPTGLPGRARLEEEGRRVVVPGAVPREVGALVAALEATGAEVVDLSVEKPNLQDAFLALTGGKA